MTTPSEEYREIPLSRGQVTKVSPHRFEELNQWKWAAVWSRSTSSFYAQRAIGGRKNRETVIMHRYILGLQYGDANTGDHVNHDTLDNRDCNLRVATRAQQMYNLRVPNVTKTSRFKGVSWDKFRNKWTAHISVNNRPKALGRFDTEEEAYAVYCQMAKALRGEFASL